MRTLDDRELDSVSGGSLLLIAGLIGANILGGLLNAARAGSVTAAAAGNGQAVGAAGAATRATALSTTAVTPGGTHGFAPATRRPGDALDALVQRGAGIVEAGIEDLAGHLAAGVRDAGDLLGRLV